jgi:hypothetical protein
MVSSYNSSSLLFFTLALTFLTHFAPLTSQVQGPGKI